MAQKKFIIDGGFDTNADSTISGNLEMTGSILPSADNTYDLGSPTKVWKDVYVGPGSLYVNGKKVLEDDSDTITISTDTDQDLRITTHGTGSLELFAQGTGNVQMKATLQMEDGKKITNSAGNPVQFGDKIDMDNNQMINLAAPTAAGHAANKSYVDAQISSGGTTANTYTDTEIATATTALQSYADQAEADAISTAAADATAKADAAEANAIATVTGGAGAAFDTLSELKSLMDAADTGLTNAINAITVGNGTMTISAGNGLSGGGNFTANQTGNSSVAIAVNTGNGLTISSDAVVMSGSYTGSFTATGDITAYSDDSLKTNVEVIDGALGRVEAIRGVTFERIEDGSVSTGVIAQELEAVLPEAVKTDEDGLKHVAYGNITGLLIEAVKELSAQVAELKK